jgi:hypothetical protein
MSNRPLPPLKVGQVIFLIPNGERRVLPAQVTEEIFRRTLSGQETAWNIQVAGSEKAIQLDPNAAEYFTSLEELRSSLVEKVTAQIDRMIGSATEIAEAAFKQPVKPVLAEVADSMQEEDDLDDEAPPPGKKVYRESESGNVRVILPDGTSAKVRLG